MTTGEVHDLLVVGAGPVGCRVAAEVARAGYDVVILEQKSTLDDSICCTGLISDECLSRFGIEKKLILNSFGAATVFSPAGNTISVRRDLPQAYALSRPALDQWFYQTAVTHGARGIFGRRVTDVLPSTGGVTAVLARGRHTENIKARAVVLAAGFGSELLNSFGLKRARDWAMGVQAEAETTDGRDVEIYIGRTYAPGFFAWMVPTTSGRAHIGLMSHRRTKAYFGAFLARLQKDGKVKENTPPAFRGITLAPPSRTYSERMLIVGDLAGHVKPITGGGVYYGLLCADIAARHMVVALRRDDFSARKLSAYEREWRVLLGRELKLGRRARRAFGLIRDRELEFLFRIAKRRALAERMARQDDIGFDWHGAAIGRAWRFLNPFYLKESE